MSKQIVIDIDSYVLEHCKRHVREHYANNIEEAIANGVPLEDKIKKVREEIENKIHKDPYLNFSNRNRERNDAFIEALEILDKLISESGVEE